MSDYFSSPNDLIQTRAERMSALAADNPQFASSSPGAAFDAFNASSDLAVPAIANSLRVQSTAQAAQETATQQDTGSGAFGWLHSILNGIGQSPVGTVLSYMNKPLQEIQKDYKFLHSVYTRHGIWEGLAATALVGGGVALGALAGPEGAIAAADLVLAGERNILGRMEPWKDSLADSDNPDYKVSFGRDVANFVGDSVARSLHRWQDEGKTNTDTGWGKMLSGATDAVSDITFDPVRIVAQVPAGVAGGKYLELAEAADGSQAVRGASPIARIKPVQDFLTTHAKTAYSPEQLDAIRYGVNGGDPVTNSYNKALDHLASLDAAGVVQRYPQLRPIADQIGGMGSADKIHEYLRETLWQQADRGAIAGPAMLPSRTVMRASGQRVADMLRQGTLTPATEDAAKLARLDQRGMLANQSSFLFPRQTFDAGEQTWQTVPSALTSLGGAARTVLTGRGLQAARNQIGDAWGSAVARKVRTFSGYQAYDVNPLEGLSKKTFNLLDPTSLEPLRRMFRYSMSEQSTNNIINEMAAAQRSGVGSLNTLRTLYHTGVLNMVKAAGLPDDIKLVQKITSDLGYHATDDASVEYGIDHLGNSRSLVSDGEGTRGMAIRSDQTTNTANFVDFREMKRAMRSLGAIKNTYGAIDDFASKHFTQSWFKPLALLTGGFGLRIAASEMIPAFMRYGTWNVVKSHIAVGAARANARLLPGEEEHVAAAAVPALVGAGRHADALDATTPDDIRAILDEAGASDSPMAAKVGTAATVGMGMRLYGNEVADAARAVRGKFSKMVGETQVALGRSIAPEDFDLASHLLTTNGAHVGNGVSLAGHGLDDDLLEQQRQIADLMAKKFADPGGNIRWREGEKWGQWSPKDAPFKMYWLRELQKSSQNLPMQLIAKDVSRRLGETGDVEEAWKYAARQEEARIRDVAINPASPYKAESRTLERYLHQDPGQFAWDRTSSLRGITTGADETLHEDLLDQIASGIKPDADALDGLAQEMLPRKVIGPELEPYKGNSLLTRITQNGFTKIVDPIVNKLSREPLYFAAVKREMGKLRYGVSTGKLTEQQALGIAQLRATHAILPQIHNTALRTQFSIMANNYLPFYFAQEQAYKRLGHLVMSNPAALRSYQMIFEGMSNPAFVQVDSQGNRHWMIPGGGAIGTALQAVGGGLGLNLMAGLPMSVDGNMDSLRTVLPEMQLPGVSPFVSMAAQGLANLDPNLQRVLSKTIGDQAMNSTWLQALIPNAPVRNALIALSPIELDRSLTNAQLAAVAAAYYHGQMPDPNASPQERQAALDRLRMNARSILFIKALIGMASPLAPTVTQEDPGLRDEWNKTVTKSKSYPDAITAFLGKHGNAAISYTVAKTAASVPGALTPYTNDAIQWIQDNGALVNGKTQTGAAFLVPQAPGGGDAQAIHDELLKMHVRENRVPDDFLKAIYVAAGNNQIAADSKAHSDYLTAANGRGDSAGVDAERANWTQYIAKMGQWNPLWWDDYQSSDKTHVAMRAVNDLKTIFTKPQAPQFYTNQTSLTQNLMQDYEAHQSYLNELRAQQIGGGAITAEENAWKAYLLNLADTQPLLAPIVRSVFLRVANQ